MRKKQKSLIWCKFCKVFSFLFVNFLWQFHKKRWTFIFLIAPLIYARQSFKISIHELHQSWLTVLSVSCLATLSTFTFPLSLSLSLSYNKRVYEKQGPKIILCGRCDRLKRKSLQRGWYDTSYIVDHTDTNLTWLSDRASTDTVITYLYEEKNWI